ncbi:MAG: hypothetical protein PVI06_15345 [Desulfobacterales bacterium]|jgi:ABC-type amino acid transport substrate-binding protein
MDKKRVAAIPLLAIWFVLPSGHGSTESAMRNDLLAKIMARGTLFTATDPDYPPQSRLKPGATRASDTKCASTQYTANGFTGFDVDTAIEIARRPCFCIGTIQHFRNPAICRAKRGCKLSPYKCLFCLSNVL